MSLRSKLIPIDTSFAIPTRYVPFLKKEGRTNSNLVLGGLHRAIFDYIEFGETAEALRGINTIAKEPKQPHKGPMLIWASYCGNLEVVKKLLDMGVDINYHHKDPFSGMPITGSPLVYASKQGHVDVVRELCERGAAVNFNGVGGSPLLGAIKGNHLEVVRALLQYDAEIHGYDKKLEVAEDIAKTTGDRRIYELLMDNFRNENNSTPNAQNSVSGGKRRNLTRRSKKSRKNSKKTRRY